MESSFTPVLYLVAMVVAALLSVPVWLPLVFVGYAMGRRKFSLSLVFLLVTLEAASLGLVLWWFREGVTIPVY